MTYKPVEIPPEWEKVDIRRLSGTLMVVGSPDVGKSTFARYIFQRLCMMDSHQVAYLDGDPGQSILGPPTTMTLAQAAEGDVTFPPRNRIWRCFVGALSPKGHMLPVLTAAARLVAVAREANIHAIIYDTTGLVDPAQGGTSLKLAKVDLLRPKALFAIQRGHELESLLVPLRRSSRVNVVDLPSSSIAQRRETVLRQAHRAEKFARYFCKSSLLKVRWPQFAVFPAPYFVLHQLVALEDSDGFTLGLGIVREFNRQSRYVVLHTPVASLHGVNAMRLGDVAVDPLTFKDRRLDRKL